MNITQLLPNRILFVTLLCHDEESRYAQGRLTGNIYLNEPIVKGILIGLSINAKTRNLFVAQKIEFDDFYKLKKQYLTISIDLNVNDKKHLINFMPPSDINIHVEFLLNLSPALSKILSIKKQHSKPSQLPV